jgi:hypothetical protein
MPAFFLVTTEIFQITGRRRESKDECGGAGEEIGPRKGITKETKKRVEEMTGERNCGWMSGPRDAGLRVSAVRWWLAISRDELVNSYRRRTQVRPPVACRRTPTFTSPILK